MSPLAESRVFRQIRQIAQFATGSLTSYASEIATFALLVKVLFKSEADGLVIFSMVFARAVSIIVQYSINRFFVFRSRIRLGISFPRYLAVNLGLLSISYLLVRFFHNRMTLDITLVKMSVDLVLFFVNYLLQRLFVFEYGPVVKVFVHPLLHLRHEKPGAPSGKEYKDHDPR